MDITQIKNKQILFHQKISQEKEHSSYGAVVPEMASRLHAKILPQILKKVKPYFHELKAVAVTIEPGLNVTLLEGLMMAKTLCFSLDLPLIGVNHLKGHLYSLFLEKDSIFPLGALLVSGGHTMLLEAKAFDEIRIVAQSIDDSFGESFDKGSKMLGLGYPGGPIVESRAKRGNAESFGFSLPLKSKKQFAFSFSGLKNAVRLEIEKGNKQDEKFVADICASFQKTAIQHLCQKFKIFFELNASDSRGWKHFGIIGGASANLALREKIQKMCDEFGIALLVAPLEYCSDNAAMIGRVGLESYLRGEFSPLEIQTKPKIQSI